MVRLYTLAAAVGLLAIGTLARAQDTDELKAILNKAIAAHGGEKGLAKYQAGSSKFKGTMKIAGMAFNVTGETWIQKPYKMKGNLALEKDGNTIDVIRVYDGKTFWVASMGKTQEIKDEKILTELRETLDAEGGASLMAFQKKPYELSAVGEVKVKDKAAIGIRVSKKGGRDVNYFFDKKTHLVVKIEMRGLDPLGQKEVTQEKFIVGYQDKAGLKVAQRVVILNDGDPFMDIEITDVQMLEKLDDSMFAMP